MKTPRYRIVPVIIAVFLVLFVYIYFQVESKRMGRTLAEMKQLVEKERYANTQLHVSLNSVSSPERLDKMAGEMGFAAPDKKQIIEFNVKNESGK